MTSGTNFRWVTAVVAALTVASVVGLVAPRYVGSATGWMLSIGLGVVAAVAVILATRDKVDDGKKVRDDALDR